jgi:hypothetical protein
VAPQREEVFRSFADTADFVTAPRGLAALLGATQMQKQIVVKVQRNGHPPETLTNPHFEDVFNKAGGMQATFLDPVQGEFISLPLRNPPSQASITAHRAASGDLYKAETGFSHVEGTFGKNLPICLTASDGRPTALYAHKTSAGVYWDNTACFYQIRPLPNPGGAVPHDQAHQLTIVVDGG